MGTSVVRGDSLAPADPPLSLLLREADALEKEREAFGTRGGGGGEGGGGGRSARSHLSVLGGALIAGRMTDGRANGREDGARLRGRSGAAGGPTMDRSTHARTPWDRAAAGWSSQIMWEGSASREKGTTGTRAPNRPSSSSSSSPLGGCASKREREGGRKRKPKKKRAGGSSSSKVVVLHTRLELVTSGLHLR